MYVADLSSEGLTDMPGLQFSGIRATRARYPNGGLGVLMGEAQKAGTPAEFFLLSRSAPSRFLLRSIAAPAWA